MNTFLEARDFLLRHRDDYETAYRDFQWPKLDAFNWALDYFDGLAPTAIPPTTARRAAEHQAGRARGAAEFWEEDAAR